MARKREGTMGHCFRRGSLALPVLLVLTPMAWPQASYPQIGYVFPAGAQQGSTVQVKIGGQYLEGATRLQISGTGVEAKILGQTRPLTERELAALRRKLDELNKKTTKS